MNSSVIVILVLGFLVVLGVVWHFQHQANEQRRSEFRRIASERGWRFVEKDDSYARRWDGKPFTRGGRSQHVVNGEHRGRRFAAFEYSYTTTSSNGQSTTTTTHFYAVCAVDLPASVPDFSVGGEGIFGGKVAKAFGVDRVDIGDDDFDTEFKVKSDDTDFGLSVLQPPVVDYLKHTGAWQWRFTGASMLAVESGRFEPAQLVSTVDRMCDVLERVAPEVWQREGRLQ